MTNQKMTREIKMAWTLDPPSESAQKSIFKPFHKAKNSNPTDKENFGPCMGLPQILSPIV